MEIELYAKMTDPLDAIDRIGEFFAKSAMFGCDRPEQGKVLAMTCLAEGKSPAAFARDFDLVGGKLRKKALASLADFRRAGGKHKWLKTGDDGKEACLELTYDGQTIVSKFTIEDANRQGLVRPRSNWEKAPANMLRARAITNGVAMLCPEIFAGEEPSDDMPADPPAIVMQPQLPPELKSASVVEMKPATIPPSLDEKAKAAMGLAPLTKQESTVTTVAPAEVTAPAGTATTPTVQPSFAKGPGYACPAGMQIDDDLVSQLEAAIGEHAVAATTWMLKEGWLQKGQGLASLTPARAKRIINQRDSFLRAIGATK